MKCDSENTGDYCGGLTYIKTISGYPAHLFAQLIAYSVVFGDTFFQDEKFKMNYVLICSAYNN